MAPETDRSLVNIDQFGHFTFLIASSVRGPFDTADFCTTGPLLFCLLAEPEAVSALARGSSVTWWSVMAILSTVFPTTALIACGFEHSVANMYLLPIGVVFTRGSRHHSQSLMRSSQEFSHHEFSSLDRRYLSRGRTGSRHQQRY
ncbi:MAG TPA: hypothetical protein VES92_03170 [Nitrospiraceae bacterium]|nr:hypothetical protein [Nitrospiraceae bacterium]